MSREPIKILFTSAGRRVGLIQCFRNAAEELGFQPSIFACDLDASLSAGCQIADASFNVPRCSEPNYADAVLALARTHGINVTIPTIDPELMPLTKSRDAFAALGTHVHVSSPSVIAVAQDKIRTAAILKAAGIATPSTFALADIRKNPALVQWPAFLKPVAGSASRGIRVVHSAEELPERTEEPMLVQDFLNGPEYTINMFIDRSGVLRSSVIHKRLQVRAGEVEKGRTENRNDLQDIAKQVAAALPEARGVLCFQVIDDKMRGPLVFEINARFGGGYPLVDRAGGKFARWLLEEATGRDSSATERWQDGVLMLRYDAAVFSD